MPWLDELTPESMNEAPLPLHDILSESAYYPASGTDGSLVALCGHYFQSYVYVDYRYTREEINTQINRICPQCARSRGFRGYWPLGQRDVRKEELIPNGWAPNPLPPVAMYHRLMLPPHRDNYLDAMQNPFATWAVFKRIEGYGEDHGPIRFSLLYVRAEGVAAYQALYHRQQISPACVAIVNPGHGFGGNWDNFTDEHGFFGRNVLNGPCAAPRYLLDHPLHLEEPPAWPAYTQMVRAWPDQLKRLMKRPE